MQFFKSGYVLGCLLFISIQFGLHGQAKFYTQLDAREIKEGSYLTVTFTLENAQGRDFAPPDFKGFDVLSGPSSSSRTSIVNGRSSFKQSIIYTLRPKKRGVIKIGSASITAQKKRYKTKPIQISVIKSTVVKDGRLDYYIKMELSDSIVHPGQQIVVDYVLYYSIDKKIQSVNIKSEDKFEGFFATPLNNSNAIAARKIIDGKEYVSQTVRKVALFPQTAGTFKFDQANFILYIPKNNKRRFFFNSFLEEPILSNKVELVVKPLPPNPDPYFCGAVGKYFCVAYSDKKTVASGQSLTLNLRVVGDGDPKLIRPPTLKISDDFDVYDPNILNEEIYLDQGKLKHKTIYEYLIVPNKKGKYKISPSINYFSVDSNDYVDYLPPSIDINVVQGASSEFDKDATLTQRSDKMVAFKKNISNVQWSFSLFNTIIFWILCTIILSGFPIVAFLKRKKVKELNLDPEEQKYNRAKLLAEKRLHKAQQFMNDQDQRSFYNEVSKAIYGFVSDKLGIPPSELGKQNVTDRLKELNVSLEAIDNIEEILRSSEMALFAASNEESKMNSIYSMSLSTIADIEQQVS